MSTIVQQPDALSFSGNLKSFEINTNASEVVFELWKDSDLIISEKYAPDQDGHVSINIATIIDRLLSVNIPGNNNVINEQTTGAGNFTATVDGGTGIDFRVIKGGVFELQELAGSFMAENFLSWQPQEKSILQSAPEWLGIYTILAGTLKLKAYYADNTTYTGDYAALDADKLYSINTSWGIVSAWLLGLSQSTQVVAWDVWYEVGAVKTIAKQRYQLRNADDEEHLFIWANTLGGIDSKSFTGAAEDDQKLEHKTALYDQDVIEEYDVEKLREVKQSTGYLDTVESDWLKDFFVSRKKYVVRPDGSLKQIAVVSSKVVDITLDDLADYEFTYRFSSDSPLLNLNRTLSELAAPEGLSGFFLAELLSGLTEALYADNLNLAVQSPFVQGWQKLSFAQLWGAALPTLVDGYTIAVIDGKLKVIGDGSSTAFDWEVLKQYVLDLFAENTVADTTTELISGSIIWITGLTYRSTDIYYKINGVKYTSPAKEIILDAAHPTLSRMDVFYVDTFSNLHAATGTPSENPVKPILTFDQLEITTLLIAPGATIPVDVAVEKVYDENVEWATSESHNTGVSVDFNAGPALTGSKCIKVTIDLPEGQNQPLHYIGEKYQGGVIFWLNETGKTGLIAAEDDTALDEMYSSLSGHSVYSTGATGVEIGAGQANTALMLDNDAAKDAAVKYCDDLIIGGYNDFYMPSEKELLAMYLRRYEIGNFANKTYWSSTETEWNKARCVAFSGGATFTRLKTNRYCVRAIRSFDDSSLPAVEPITTVALTNTAMVFVGPDPVTVQEGILSLNLKSSASWVQNSMLLIESFLGTERTGSVAISLSTSLYGFIPDEDRWQLVALQMTHFAPSKDNVDSFRISLCGAWPNGIELSIDDIRFQYSSAMPQLKTYGSATKHIQMQLGAGNKIVSVKDIDVKPVEEILTGVINGTNKIFVTSIPFEPGTIMIFLNGLKYHNFIEVPDSETQIELADAPKTGGFTDDVSAIFIKKQV